MNNKPYTQNEYINKVKDINPNIVVLGEYTNAHSTISAQCKICGTKWMPRAYQLIQGTGCPECGKKLAVENRKGKTAKKTTEQFVQELSVVNDSISVVSEYTGSKDKIECICNACKFRWKTTPYTLLTGRGCPNCWKTKRVDYRRYTHESFKEKLFLVNPDIELISQFTKSTERIEAKCKRCGNVWFPKAYALLQGRGCPNCSHKRALENNRGKTGLKTYNDFKNELAQVDDSIEVIGEYNNTHTNIKCRCSRCNHVWKAKPYSLLQGHGCPRCAKSGTSFMEQLILFSFRNVLGEDEVLSRNKSLINMELDIVIPKYGIAIEPGNWFLHKKSLKRDELKRLRCEEINIRLITIYDKYPEDKTLPFVENCYVFNDDLNVIDHSVIHNLIYDLFRECGIDKQFSDDEWKYLEDLAYDNSKSLTHEEFIDKLYAIRPDIEVIGKYENANRRIEVTCRNCGFVWNGIPANLLQGDGCRKCGAKLRGDKNRKTQEDFENELKELIPSVKVIGTYITRHKPVEFECLKCGNVWKATPGSLLRKEHINNPNNNGCPKCAKFRKGTPRKKVMNIDTGEIFESAIEAGDKYGIVPSAIRQCCRGINETSKGFHWKYI